MGGHADTSREGRGSAFSGFINFFKQMFGAGVLALPHAFTWSGLAGGLGVYSLVLAVCCYSQVLLVWCLAEAQRQHQTTIVTYVELSGATLGPLGGRMVGALVVILELCFTSGWVIVACQNIGAETGLHQSLLALILWPIITLLSWVPHLEDLWPLSILGLLVFMAGVMGTIYWHIGEEVAAGRAAPEFEVVRWATLPQFIGTAVYGLEAILMVIPVTRSLRDRGAAPCIIGWGTALYAVIAISFGAISYMYGFGSCPGFGSGGKIITDCLPAGTISSVVRWALAVTMIVGYPVILFPITATLENWLGLEAPSSSSPQQSSSTPPAREKRRGSNGQRYALLSSGQNSDDSNTGAAGSSFDTEVSVSSAADPTSPLSGPAVVSPAHAAALDSSVGAISAGSSMDKDADVAEPSAASPGIRFLQWKKRGLRAAEVAVTASVAAACRDISSFSSLVGALLVTIAGFVLPPIIHWKLWRARKASPGDGDEHSNSWLWSPRACVALTADVGLILFGSVTCVIGTYSAVQDLVNPNTTTSSAG